MSTYNETYDEIRKSLQSILHQSYKNIELLVVIDNPDNYDVINYLKSLTDNRVRIIYNEKNLGFVASLNKALSLASGNFIARMDADDICELNRLSLQFSYLTENNLDLLGGSIKIIDENDNLITKQHFPSTSRRIEFFLNWGNCVPHPTWLVKKEVYDQLNGYRNVPRCEDFDFICRAIRKGYKIGNLNHYILQYRVRKKSISNSNKGEQYLIRRYISKNRFKPLTIEEINDYRSSNKYTKSIRLYNSFQKAKTQYNQNKKFLYFGKMITNKYFYFLGMEKIFVKIRNYL